MALSYLQLRQALPGVPKSRLFWGVCLFIFAWNAFENLGWLFQGCEHRYYSAIVDHSGKTVCLIPDIEIITPFKNGLAKYRVSPYQSTPIYPAACPGFIDCRGRMYPDPSIRTESEYKDSQFPAENSHSYLVPVGPKNRNFNSYFSSDIPRRFCVHFPKGSHGHARVSGLFFSEGLAIVPVNFLERCGLREYGGYPIYDFVDRNNKFLSINEKLPSLPLEAGMRAEAYVIDAQPFSEGFSSITIEQDRHEQFAATID